MVMLPENIALILATSQIGSEVTVMSSEQMKREKLYQATMSLVRNMLENGLISREEYAVIDTKMREKYNPTLGTLFSDIDLI
jgi:ribonuclease HII